MWTYTPRQIAAFNFLAAKRQARDSHRLLQLMALAGSGDGKEITKQLEAWERND